MIEVVPAGIVQISPRGAIVRANEKARAFLGLAWDVLLARYVQDWGGDTIFEDGSPCPIEKYPVAQCLTTGHEQGPLTLGVRRPDGEVRWGIFSAVPCPFPGEDRN